jgi:hypothetical protein
MKIYEFTRIEQENYGQELFLKSVGHHQTFFVYHLEHKDILERYSEEEKKQRNEKYD